MSIKSNAPNIVELAVTDVATAAAILRKPRGVVLGLDLRRLAGGAQCQAIGPQAFDVYCGAVDACLSRMRGLSIHGYELRRAAVAR